MKKPRLKNWKETETNEFMYQVDNKSTQRKKVTSSDFKLFCPHKIVLVKILVLLFLKNKRIFRSCWYDLEWR
jgi:hypothetical protein